MEPESSIVEVISLKITATSENFLKVDYISLTRGIAYSLFRIRKKNDCPPPDLFDSAKVTFSSKDLFFKEYTPIIKRGQIGTSFSRLNTASTFALFLLNNALHCSDPAEIYKLANRVFDALQEGYSPQIILLKAKQVEVQ